MEHGKKIIFSGIQPSGVQTLGNYIGAVRNWANMQDEYSCIYSVVNLHAITVRQDAKMLKEKTMEMYALLMACGIDTQKSILFVQSQVPAHTQLMWVLNCYTYFGELGRMTQFKEKSERHPDNVNAGLFDYPVLMAADILLYNTDLVPVGEDQKQHLEITRDIALRFNRIYGEVFTIPEPYIPKVGARVMSLAEPDKKMSKSDDNPNAYISILDSPDVVLRKIKRAVTDSDTINPIRASVEKKGVTNLMNIYAVLTGKSITQIENEFEGKGYGDFKPAVAQAIIDAFEPIQKEYKRIISDKGELENLMKQGTQRAEAIADRTLKKVYKKVGLL